MADVAKGARVVIMSEQDTVATALADLAAGTELNLSLGGRTWHVVLRQDIAAGHKFALVAMAPGEPVRKYGEVIGVAEQPIAPGEHVHVHNVGGTRGRGDQAAAGAAKEGV